MLRKMVSNRMFQLGVALAVTAGMIAACGGSSNPMSPSSSGTVPTVTVTGSGVSPQEVRISIGGRVRFVNNDTVNRQINSNPFPAHDGLSADQRGRRVDFGRSLAETRWFVLKARLVQARKRSLYVSSTQCSRRLRVPEATT